jgi:hypothetical protein
MYGGEERWTQDWGDLRRGHHLEDSGVDGRIILT